MERREYADFVATDWTFFKRDTPYNFIFIFALGSMKCTAIKIYMLKHVSGGCMPFAVLLMP